MKGFTKTGLKIFGLVIFIGVAWLTYAYLFN